MNDDIVMGLISDMPSMKLAQPPEPIAWINAEGTIRLADGYTLETVIAQLWKNHAETVVTGGLQNPGFVGMIALLEVRRLTESLHARGVL